MCFYAHTAFDDSSNRFDFYFRNCSGLASAGHQAIYSRRCQDMQPAVDAPFQKHVARKQGQCECFSPVLPIMGGCIKRKERVKSLVGQNLIHHFLMLMASVERIPGSVTKNTLGRAC